MPAYPLTQLNLELIVSNSLSLGKELTLDLIVSWQVPLCRVFYMLWGWAPFEKQWNQELFVFNLEFAGIVYQAVGSCIPRFHQYYSSGLAFWSVDWVCHPRGWVQIKTCRNQHVLKDVERRTRASTARWHFQVVMCIGGIFVLWWFIVTLQVCIRCDDSLWSWHVLGFNVVSANT